MSFFEWTFFLSLFSFFVIFSFVSFALCIQTTQNRKISGISSVIFLFIALFIGYYGAQYTEERIREKTIEDVIKFQQEYRDKKLNKPKNETLHVFGVDRKI